jgi:nucleoside-diphosphate-sugar epimerase
MKKVLITGASGFVGFHLIIKALAANLDVYAAVRPNSDTQHLQDLPIHFVILDFSSVDQLKVQLEKEHFNFVIHAAAITKAKSAEVYNHVNAELTKNLARALVQLSYTIEKFIFISSLAAIGPLKVLSGQIEDDTIAKPVSNYGRSKLLAESYLKEIENLPLIVVRPTAVYGPREKDIFILVNSIRKGIEPYIGKFVQQLSFIYVSDLAHIIVKSLESSILKKSYNISDGRTYTRYAFADYTKMLLRNKTIKIHIPIPVIKLSAMLFDLIYARKKETPVINSEKIDELVAVNWACNIDSIKKDLDFSPEFDLKMGLKETISWYKKNNWL